MSEAQQTPLTELLRKVPKHHRISWQEFREDGSSAGYHLCPIGKMAHEAADKLTTAQAEIEALRGRVAELEELGANLVLTFDQTLTDTLNFEDYETLKRVVEPFREVSGNPEAKAWLLRKQAEAVEAFVSRFPRLSPEARKVHGDLTVARETLEREAKRLRAEADHLEAGTAGGGE